MERDYNFLVNLIRKVVTWIKWGGLMIILLMGVLVATILFYKPVPDKLDAALQIAKEQRAIVIKQREATDKLADEQAKTNEALNKRNDDLKTEIVKNRDAIIKSKKENDKENNNINRYNSPELTREFAELKR